MYKHTALVGTAEIESEFDLERKDMMYYLSPLMEKAASPIEMDGGIVGRYEIKEQSVRAWAEGAAAEHKPSEVPFPEHLDAYLRDISGGDVRRTPAPVVSAEDVAMMAAIDSKLFGEGRIIGSCVYVHMMQFCTIRSAAESRFDPCTTRVELKRLHFGTLLESENACPGTSREIYGSRHVPNGWLYITDAEEVSFTQPRRGYTPSLRSECLHQIIV